MKIELDKRELEIMLDALDARIADLEKSVVMASGNLNPEISDQIAELGELQCDLFESLHRDDDFRNDAVPDAAAEFIQAGIDAREEVKASSRAAERRNERLMKGTVTGMISNDPIDW